MIYQIYDDRHKFDIFFYCLYYEKKKTAVRGDSGEDYPRPMGRCVVEERNSSVRRSILRISSSSCFMLFFARPYERMPTMIQLSKNRIIVITSPPPIVVGCLKEQRQSRVFVSSRNHNG